MNFHTGLIHNDKENHNSAQFISLTRFLEELCTHHALTATFISGTKFFNVIMYVFLLLLVVLAIASIHAIIEYDEIPLPGIGGSIGALSAFITTFLKRRHEYPASDGVPAILQKTSKRLKKEMEMSKYY